MSPLARITNSLAVRGRIGVVLMVADLALSRLHGSPDFPFARSAFDLCRRWYDGDRFDPDRFEEAYAREDGGGVVCGAMNVRSQSELAAWSVLASAIMYIAFQAYREIGSYPTPIVSEVRENELDEMYRHMQTISPMFIETARRATKILGQGREPSFAQLKAILLRGLAPASLELEKAVISAHGGINKMRCCDSHARSVFARHTVSSHAQRHGAEPAQKCWRAPRSSLL
jgi:hypothetical protein